MSITPLFKDGIKTLMIDSATTSDNINWTIPELDNSTNYKIKVVNSKNASIFGESEQFTISKQIEDFIDITTTDSEDSWYIDSTYQITWDDNISQSVKIDLIKGSMVHSTVLAETFINSYSWTIPDTIEIGDDYKIKVVSNEDNQLFDEGELFSIQIVSSTRIDDNYLTDNFKIYPNPVNGILNIECFNKLQHEPVNASIYDMIGNKVITHSSYEDIFTIDVSQLPAGIFNVIISYENKVVNQKLIKQ